jgi:phage I-like protein
MKKIVLTYEANASYAMSLGGSAPTEIMYMPAGKSKITPLVNGKAKEIDVEVDASTAKALQDNLDRLLAENVRPFIDFDHGLDGRTTAAALPKQFRWEPGKGIYLSLEWTRSGQQAIEGKDYSYFSPSFMVSEDGKPLGLPESGAIGALTNNPAFREIQRIAASRSNPGTSAGTNPDDDEPKKVSAAIKKTLIDHGLLDAEDLDEGDDKVVPKLKKKLKAMNDEADASKAKAKMADDEKEEAKAELAQLQEAAAESVVNAAVTAGKIAPKSEATKKFYIESFKRDPKATQLVIAELPVNPALHRLVKVDGTDRSSTGASPNGSTGNADRDLMNAQRVVIEEIKAASPNMSTEAIFVKAKQQRPELFTE